MGKENPAGLAGKGRKSGLSEEGEGGGMNPSMGRWPPCPAERQGEGSRISLVCFSRRWDGHVLLLCMDLLRVMQAIKAVQFSRVYGAWR